MDATQRALKRNSLLLWDAIKRDDLLKIQEIVLSEAYPIDTAVTDTGMSALQFACTWSSNPEVFKILFQKNPNFNHVDFAKRTPLHTAALFGNMIAL